MSDSQPCPNPGRGDLAVPPVNVPQGEHVVITPQTAGSAGGAHTDTSDKEN